MTELQRLTHPDPDMVYACPHCDEAGVRHRKDGSNSDFDPDAPMACYECNTGVYEPVERESRSDISPLKQNAGSRSAKHGPAADIEAMDPPSEDEWDEIVAAARGD